MDCSVLAEALILIIAFVCVHVFRALSASSGEKAGDQLTRREYELQCLHSHATVMVAKYSCVQSSGEDLGTRMADLRLAQHQVVTQYLIDGGIRHGLFG